MIATIGFGEIDQLKAPLTGLIFQSLKFSLKKDSAIFLQILDL